MSSVNPVLGIDLGTTYSCVAIVDEFNKPIVLKNKEGHNITPSAVFFESPTNIVVGKSAKEEAPLSPERVVTFVKRGMGDPNWSKLIDGQAYTPEQVSAIILKKLVQDAEEAAAKKFQDVVITCPAYFGINEREATRKAGEIAGLNVLQILSEPTAAAITYGMADDSVEKSVLVYDLGGGTFDVTLIQIEPDSIRVICTGGDHNLGGKDWDDEVVKYLVSQLSEKTGLSEKEIDEDLELQKDLGLNAEKMKMELSNREKTTSPVINCGGQRIKIELTRQDFQDLTGDLLERTISLTHEMLEQAKQKGYERFDELLLVGGSSRMSIVAPRLQKEFGLEPRLFDPDESVAKGAALFGTKMRLNDELLRRVQKAMGQEDNASEIGESKNATFTLASAPSDVVEQAAQQLAAETGFTLGAVKNQKKIINVSSQSFGVVAYNAQGQERGVHLVLKNTEVPVQKTQQFGTQEANQPSVEVQIIEADTTEREVEYSSQDPRNNISTLIGTAVLDLPPGLPIHSPITITFELNEEGRLEVTAIDAVSGNRIQTHIKTTSVIGQEAAEEAKLLLASQKVD